MKYKSIFISDVHLGTRFSKAKKLLNFLKHNECENLILVGDIIDGWAIKRKFIWPQTHSDVIQKILFNVALFLAILLSNALIIINTDSFYEFEFNKNNTSLKTGINHSDLFIVVDNIQDFFNEKSNEKI